jgi:hypothetical protein
VHEEGVEFSGGELGVDGGGGDVWDGVGDEAVEGEFCGAVGGLEHLADFFQCLDDNILRVKLLSSLK